jgi:hypothetical protein
MPEKRKTTSHPQTGAYEWSSLPDAERRRQIRDLITSQVWGCLPLDQRERWLDQFQDLT